MWNNAQEAIGDLDASGIQNAKAIAQILMDDMGLSPEEAKAELSTYGKLGQPPAPKPEDFLGSDPAAVAKRHYTVMRRDAVPGRRYAIPNEVCDCGHGCDLVRIRAQGKTVRATFDKDKRRVTPDCCQRVVFLSQTGSLSLDDLSPYHTLPESLDPLPILCERLPV